MTIDQTLQLIQVAYPQVYLACHTRHQRKRSTVHHLSARDAAILAHLDAHSPTVPARLAGHLSIGRSTLSEALKRLTALGYVAKMPRASASSNGSGVRLTQRGLDAIRETSVLEEDALRGALTGLSSHELRSIARGMSTLARACRGRATAVHTPT